MLLTDGRRLDYDCLIIATGVTPRPDQTDGMLGDEWRQEHPRVLHVRGLRRAWPRRCRTWPGGQLVIHIVEMPIKCPVAPLEFAFLADAFFKDKGMRDEVEMTYVTPLDAAFTKPIAAEAFGNTLEEKGITVVPDFMIESVDGRRRRSSPYDESEVPFDLLVTIPLNMGADFVARSGLGNEINLVPVDKFTQQSKAYANMFALGDANDIPASKAGSVAHFEIDIFVENFLQFIAGAGDDPQVRRSCQLLHRDGWRQGDAHRLQLRHRAAAGQVPAPDPSARWACSRRPVSTTSARCLPVGLLEHAHAWASAADPQPDVAVRQAHRPDRRQVTRQEEKDMPTTTINGREVSVDDEGFMTVYDQWDEEMGAALATAIGVEMTDEHWKAIRFLREDFKTQGETPTIRRVSTVGGIRHQAAVRPVPQEAGQEDGLHRRAAQAARLRLSGREA